MPVSETTLTKIYGSVILGSIVLFVLVSLRRGRNFVMAPMMAAMRSKPLLPPVPKLWDVWLRNRRDITRQWEDLVPVSTEFVLPEQDNGEVEEDEQVLSLPPPPPPTSSSIGLFNFHWGRHRTRPPAHSLVPSPTTELAVQTGSSRERDGDHRSQLSGRYDTLSLQISMLICMPTPKTSTASAMKEAEAAGLDNYEDEFENELPPMLLGVTTVPVRWQRLASDTDGPPPNLSGVGTGPEG